MDREMLFWAIALVMILVACAAMALAFLCPKRFVCGKVDADDMNRELLNQELKNLEAEYKAGLTTKAIYEESVEDVKRRALEDLAKTKTVEEQGNGGLITMLASCAFVAAAALGLYSYLGSPSLIVFADSVQNHGIMQEDGSLADTTPTYDIRTMRAYLAENAGDERAWTLYARLLAEAKDWPAASQAYKTAIDLNGKVAKDPEVYLEYAASLMSQETHAAYEEAYSAIESSLLLDETNANAHELAAIAALELQMWSQARSHLEFLLGRLTFDSPAYKSIAETAAYAAQQERAQLKAQKEELDAKAKKP